MFTPSIFHKYVAKWQLCKHKRKKCPCKECRSHTFKKTRRPQRYESIILYHYRIFETTLNVRPFWDWLNFILFLCIFVSFLFLSFCPVAFLYILSFLFLLPISITLPLGSCVEGPALRSLSFLERSCLCYLHY